MIGCLTDPKKNHYLCSGEATNIDYTIFIVFRRIWLVINVVIYLVDLIIIVFSSHNSPEKIVSVQPYCDDQLLVEVDQHLIRSWST